MYFSIDIGKNIGKDLYETLSGECRQEHLDHEKQSAADDLELL